MNNILPEEAQKIIQSGKAAVIDVRAPDEFAGGHIPGAQNININDASLFVEKVKSLDKEASYVVNCQLGGRSSRAVLLMHELGFKNTMNLEGGITAWKKAGLAVELGIVDEQARQTLLWSRVTKCARASTRESIFR